MIYLSFYLTTILFLFYFLPLKKVKKTNIDKRIDLILHNQIETTPDVEKMQLSFYKRVILPVLKAGKNKVKRKLPGDKQAKIEQKLLQAGSPFGMNPVEFRLLQIALFFLFPIGFGIYGLLISGIGGTVIFTLIGFILGAALPNYYLKLKMKSRNKIAIKELPDVLDLLTVSLEAGLGFDGALTRVVEKKHGVLSVEFQRCLEEIRLGKTRREALTGVKERLVVQEINSTINNILQAEKLGVGLVHVLRVQSNDVRERRKQRAEEEAMKAPIKMLFPLVIFIFPSLFIVLLGPAVIQFIETFNK